MRKDPVEMETQIVGSAVRYLTILNTRHATKQSAGHNETVMLGRVTGSYNFTVSVDKEEKKAWILTAKTFKKI